MIEGRYIHADAAQEHVDDGWDVVHLGHLWPYCLATRQLKTKPAEVSNGGLDSLHKAVQ